MYIVIHKKNVREHKNVSNALLVTTVRLLPVVSCTPVSSCTSNTCKVSYTEGSVRVTVTFILPSVIVGIRSPAILDTIRNLVFFFSRSTSQAVCLQNIDEDQLSPDVLSVGLSRP